VWCHLYCSEAIPLPLTLLCQGAWLRSVGLQEQVGNRLVILVVHGAFINLLLHELLGVELRPGPLNEAGASFGFPMPNTGTSLLELPAGTNHCRVLWIGRVDHSPTLQGDHSRSLAVQSKL